MYGKPYKPPCTGDHPRAKRAAFNKGASERAIRRAPGDAELNCRQLLPTNESAVAVATALLFGGTVVTMESTVADIVIVH
jgi:hypothetical protein